MTLAKFTGLATGAAILGSFFSSLYWSRRRSGQLRNKKEAMFRALVEYSPDVVMVLDADSTIRFISPSIRQMLGYRPEDLLGTEVSRHLSRRDPGHDNFGLSEEFHQSRITRHRVELFEARHVDGSIRRLEAVIVELPDDSSAKRAYYMRDVTERESLEDELAHKAFHDSLTGLANRALFMDRLEHVLSRLARQNQPVAVLFVDIDDFKAVNDRGGHTLGDQLLITAGQRIRGCLRPTDTAARFGGDEFTVLLENVEDADSAAQIAARILQSLKTPAVLGSRELSVTASIGVAVSRASSIGTEDLLRAADAAMYRAKERKGSSYTVREAGVRGESGGQTNLETTAYTVQQERCLGDHLFRREAREL